MSYRIFSVLFLTVFLFGCNAHLNSIKKYSAQYKHNKDYKSLEIIFKSLSKGMQRTEVECLLGEPDYSPIDGQYYYDSNRSVYSEDQERRVPFGLVVDYRNRDGLITETLQEFWIGPIGE